jgi:hypothetical protein
MNSPAIVGVPTGAMFLQRSYITHGTATAALADFDKAATTAGWKRNLSCIEPDGTRCYLYEKDGFHVILTATDGPCAEGSDSCASIILDMSSDDPPIPHRSSTVA